MEVGAQIKKYRSNMGISQEELAEKVYVSRQTVSNWENNNILPSIEMLVKISRFFSVSTDYLLELDDRHYIEVTNLTEIQLAHVQQVINDIGGHIR